MYHHSEIVYQYPAALLLTFSMPGFDSQFFFDPSLYIRGNTVDLGTAFSFTDDKEISWCILHLPKVHFQNILSLDVLDGVYDEVGQRIV